MHSSLLIHSNVTSTSVRTNHITDTLAASGMTVFFQNPHCDVTLILSLRITSTITSQLNSNFLSLCNQSVSLRIFPVGANKKWEPVQAQSMEIKVLLDERVASNNARTRYEYLQAKKLQDSYEQLHAELNAAVDDINAIKKKHEESVQVFETILVKRGKLLQKMADMEIDCDKYYEAVVRQPDPLEDFDNATLQALMQPSSVYLPSGSMVTQGGYAYASDVKASTSGSTDPSEPLVFNTNPGGPGVGSRKLKNPQKFKCLDCSRRFTKFHDMKTHQKDSCPMRKNKEPRYKCAFCKKAYAHRQTKREHEAAYHTHIYLYHCRCGRGFYYSRLAVSHRTTCDKPEGKKEIKGPEAQNQNPTPPSSPEHPNADENTSPPSSPTHPTANGEVVENGENGAGPSNNSKSHPDSRTPTPTGKRKSDEGQGKTPKKHSSNNKGKKSAKKSPVPVVKLSATESDSDSDSSKTLDPHFHLDD